MGDGHRRIVTNNSAVVTAQELHCITSAHDALSACLRDMGLGGCGLKPVTAASLNSNNISFTVDGITHLKTLQLQLALSERVHPDASLDCRVNMNGILECKFVVPLETSGRYPPYAPSMSASRQSGNKLRHIKRMAMMENVNGVITPPFMTKEWLCDVPMRFIRFALVWTLFAYVMFFVYHTPNKIAITQEFVHPFSVYLGVPLIKFTFMVGKYTGVFPGLRPPDFADEALFSRDDQASEQTHDPHAHKASEGVFWVDSPPGPPVPVPAASPRISPANLRAKKPAAAARI